MTQVIVQAVKTPERLKVQEYLKEELPHAKFVYDQQNYNIHTLLLCLEASENKALIRLEDDIVLTSGFQEKAEAVIKEHKLEFIQFFSMRKADLTVGSRYEPASTYCMSQCIYIPAGYAEGLLYYYNNQVDQEKIKADRIGIDTFIQNFLIKYKMNYFLSCPSLVEHRQIKSAIDPRRSTKRQSFTFVK